MPPLNYSARTACRRSACRALFRQVLQQLREQPLPAYDAESLQRALPQFRTLALLATDAARSEADSEFRGVYLNCMRRLAAALSATGGGAAVDGEAILASALGAFILRSCISQ